MQGVKVRLETHGDVLALVIVCESSGEGDRDRSHQVFTWFLTSLRVRCDVRKEVNHCCRVRKFGSVGEFEDLYNISWEKESVSRESVREKRMHY